MNAPSAPIAMPPFLERLGLRLIRRGPDGAELRLTLLPDHENGLGLAHGDVIMTLLDAVMAVAARSADPTDADVVTIEMKTSFIRPGSGELHAHGWCEDRTPAMAFCRGEIRDADGRLVAQSMGTFRRMPVRPRRLGA